jgi:hypothetical protein
VAHRILTIALGATEPVRQASESVPPAAGGGQLSTSAREFLLQHEPKRIPEQIATLALYLKTHRNTAAFTNKDLIKTFEDAQEPGPKNLPRDIRWTIRNGWIARKSGMKDTYYLTGSGEEAVRGKFPPDVRKRTKHTPGRRRTEKGRAAKSASS